METTNQIPRRNQLEFLTPAEKRIKSVIQEVEKIGASSKLTDAVTLMSQALNLVSDHLEETYGADKLLATMQSLSYGQLSYGQRAVGLTFNPSGDEEVVNVKQAFADVIDKIHRRREYGSHSSLAQEIHLTAINETLSAQMWCVKALTWKE